VGLPNAGKSSLLARLSAATPRIADYPFTTLTPQLGLMAGPRHTSLVLADIPGLIAGAHRGAGLGHEFLRHIERTRVLAHVVDLVPADGSDPLENVRVIDEELARFSSGLARRPRILVGNKLDLTGAAAAAAALAEALACPVVRVSAATGDGLEALRQACFAACGEVDALTPLPCERRSP
jgi:Predicted GTPase